MGDQVQRESALMKADGTVQLPAASVIFGTGSASALSVWSLANSSADIRQGGQVLCRHDAYDRHCTGMTHVTGVAQI